MSFPPGKPILVMVVLAAVSGGGILLLPRASRPAMAVWVFADSHAQSYRGEARSGWSVRATFAADAPAGATRLLVRADKPLLPGDEVETGEPVEGHTLRAVESGADYWTLHLARPLERACAAGEELRVPSLVELYRRTTGRGVGVQVISTRALDVRLISLFNNRSVAVPDLVEVEIGSVGKYFLPPTEEIGFVPLNRFLRRDGLLDLPDDGAADLSAASPRDRMVRSRFAPWSKQGMIFGVPRDLHPVTITYRKDLFDEAGVELASAANWDDFHARCLRFQEYWRQAGVEGRYALELPTSASDYLVVMLLQRHINVVDDFGRVHLNREEVVDTLARYAQMVAGPRRIAAPSTPGGDLFARDLARGDLCALITADWRAGFIALRAPELRGRLAMMPLPRFDPGDAPTSTWGGTMIGIPAAVAGRGEQAVEDAWDLLKHLHLSPQALRARARVDRILPPMREHWADAVYHQADPFFSGQRVDELYIELAGQVPRRYVTPYTLLGSIALANVLADAVQYVREHERESAAALDAGVRAHCRARLERAAGHLQKRIDFERFP